jgi:phage major head subunit gpT-like protein
MVRAMADDLDFPSCENCAAIGLYVAPMLRAMEAEIGVEETATVCLPPLQLPEPHRKGPKAMITNPENIELAFKGFKTVYTDAYSRAPVNHTKAAMRVPSSAREETYGWLGQFPQMREWLTGEREVKDLEAHSFTITNRRFESTVSLTRADFDDDRLGVFSPMFQELGHLAGQHPDELVFGLLKDGFSETCYDGQYFFATDHPGVDANGDATTISNVQAGSEPAWFLLDTSRAVKPIIWQTRDDYEFESVTRPSDAQVFMTDTFLYGVRARVNAGYGLWQLAFGSKDVLSAANYTAARAAMQMLRGDKGRFLGVKPTALVVPPALEDDARKLLNTETNDGGGSNPWKATAELIVTPHVAA